MNLEIGNTVDYSSLKTPCFVFNELSFIDNINNFKKGLNKFFESAKIGYSFKTNSLPRLLVLAKERGCLAEVVSDDEFHLAKKMGFNYKEIVFNGPVKGKNVFFEAINNGSLVNIDSKREIEWLHELDSAVEIGIRINFDLEKHLPGQTSTGVKGGRFGFCYENGELHDAISQLKGIGIKIVRLHMHVSNASKSVEVYDELAEMACRIIDEERLDIKCIDFGGGYFGGGDNGEAYEAYISGIYDRLLRHNQENIEIIVEPGASVVATAFSYLTSVVDKKDTGYGRFVVTDGTRLHIDPFMLKSSYNVVLPKRNGLVVKQTICGYTCMEKDRIMDIESAELQIGDKIGYNIVGSYTMCFNPLFITYLPRVYSFWGDGTYLLVRDKWGVEEFLQKCRW